MPSPDCLKDVLPFVQAMPVTEQITDLLNGASDIIEVTNGEELRRCKNGCAFICKSTVVHDMFIPKSAGVACDQALEIRSRILGIE